MVRFWGDESSFADVFAAAGSRSLFSDQTVVVVRRAEKLRGGGKDPVEEATLDDEGEGGAEDEVEVALPRGRDKRGAKAAAPPTPELPELDASSTLILVARKADRRGGLWRKIGKAAQTIDADYLKGRGLVAAAEAEARRLGLRLPDEQLRDLVEQSGPALGRIVSELEKILLYEEGPEAPRGDIVAVTSSPPLYRLSDAITVRNKRESLALLDEALRQGEPSLRILAVAHGTVRKLAIFRALRRAGLPISEAGTEAGLLPFKIADTERAARSWSDADIGCALAVLAEADRRIKLSAPAVPLLTHALAAVATGGRV